MKRTLSIFAALALVGVAAVALYGEPETDLMGRTRGTSTMYVDCPHDNDTSDAGTEWYTDTGGITFDAGSYIDTGKIMHGLLIGSGSGNIGITMEGGGNMVLPVYVDSLNSPKIVELLRGYRIKSVDSAATTFDGRMWPLY